MRQEIGGLTEQIDPELVVLDAHVDMHAADQEPPRHVLEVAREHVVALLVGVLLARPFGKGMGRCGDGSETELVGDAADGAAQMNQLVARLLHGLAHAGADLDLRAQEFRADLAAQRLLAFGKEGRRGFLGEVAALFVDEEVFLLDAEGEAGFLDRHGPHGGTNGEARGRANECLVQARPLSSVPTI